MCCVVLCCGIVHGHNVNVKLLSAYFGELYHSITQLHNSVYFSATSHTGDPVKISALTIQISAKYSVMHFSAASTKSGLGSACSRLHKLLNTPKISQSVSMNITMPAFPCTKILDELFCPESYTVYVKVQNGIIKVFRRKKVVSVIRDHFAIQFRG